MSRRDIEEITQNNKDSLSQLCDDAWQLMATWLKLPELAKLIVACTWTHDRFNDDEVVWKSMFGYLQKTNVSTELVGSAKEYESEGLYYKSQCERVVNGLLLHNSFYANNLKLKKGKISLEETRRFRNSVLETRNKLPQFSEDPSAFCKSFFLFVSGLGKMVDPFPIDTYQQIVNKIAEYDGKVSTSEFNRGLVGKYMKVFHSLIDSCNSNSLESVVNSIFCYCYCFCIRSHYIPPNLSSIPLRNNPQYNSPSLRKY